MLIGAQSIGSGIRWSNPPETQMKIMAWSNMIISSYGMCHFTDAEHTLLFYDVHKVSAQLHVGRVRPAGEPAAANLSLQSLLTSFWWWWWWTWRNFDGKDESSCTGFSSAKAAIIVGEQGCLSLINMRCLSEGWQTLHLKGSGRGPSPGSASCDSGLWLKHNTQSMTYPTVTPMMPPLAAPPRPLPAPTLSPSSPGPVYGEQTERGGLA